MQFEQGLDLPDDLPARGLGVETLPEKAPEGAPLGVEAIAAIEGFVGLGKQRLGQAVGKTFFQLGQGSEAEEFEGLGPA
jgi:hypothetical protein